MTNEGRKIYYMDCPLFIVIFRLDRKIPYMDCPTKSGNDSVEVSGNDSVEVSGNDREDRAEDLINGLSGQAG